MFQNILNNFKQYTPACTGSTAVEHFLHRSKVMGLNPASYACTRRGKIFFFAAEAKKETITLFQNLFESFQVIYSQLVAVAQL